MSSKKTTQTEALAALSKGIVRVWSAWLIVLEKSAEPRIHWSAKAKASFSAKLDHIAFQDQRAAILVAQRVTRALSAQSLQPELGTTVAGTTTRRFAIPSTGHLIDYQVKSGELLIVRWVRSTRQRK